MTKYFCDVCEEKIPGKKDERANWDFNISLSKTEPDESIGRNGARDVCQSCQMYIVNAINKTVNERKKGEQQ